KAKVFALALTYSERSERLTRTRSARLTSEAQRATYQAAQPPLTGRAAADLPSKGAGAGGADEVVLGQAAGIVGRIAHHAAVVMHRQVRMVVLAVGHVRQRVHERHRAVVVLEGEGPHQRLAAFGKLPAGHLWLQFAQLRLGEPVLAAAAGDAM